MENENLKRKALGKGLLADKIVCITGSSRGIGRSIALAVAKEGADVVINYRQHSEKAQHVLHRIEEIGGRAVSVKADVSQRNEVRYMIQQTIEKFGRMDVLINNAGILQQKQFEDISDEDWDHMMDTNLKSVFICVQEVYKIMKKQKAGIIINMASSGGQLGGPLAVHYSASKAGVICFTKSLARLGAPFGIRSNCISPGLIDTEMTQSEINSVEGKKKIEQIPMMRSGLSEEVSRAAVFLASDDSSYITGQTINVNGGLFMV